MRIQALHLPRMLGAAALVGAGCLVHGLPALASPDANDPVGRLLAERGLLDAPPVTIETRDQRFTRQVRDGASDMVLAAMNFLGVPYRRGGNSAETGFDCSGFTRHIFEMSLGLVLPRRVDDQASAPGLFSIAKAELKPGDLVFFNTLRRTFSHVGIYVGDGKFIHAPRSGAKVRVEDMRLAYWQQRFTGARRVESAGLAPAPVLHAVGTPQANARTPTLPPGLSESSGTHFPASSSRPLDVTPLMP